MRYETIMCLDVGILLILISGLIFLINSMCVAGHRITADQWVILAKNLLFTTVVLSSFILEYAMFKHSQPMTDDNVYHYFLFNRAVTFVFTIIAVVHSSGVKFR